MTLRTSMDPELRRYLDEQAAAPRPSPATNEDRVRMVRAMFLHMLANRGSIPGLPKDVQATDVQIRPGLPARRYVPAVQLAEPLPVLVYLHGGGWVGGSVETLDPFCRLLTEAAGIAMLSVEYRLAPEHPYPAALEDTLAAVQWTRETAAAWGGDPRRIALGGDSAGGNLAAAAALRLTAREGPGALWAQLLLCPVLDHPSANHPSYTENAQGSGLDAPVMQWFWTQYAPDASPHDDGVAPLQAADLSALPPTLIQTAGYDVLRDEGLAYAEKLRAAGVPVRQMHAPDMHHNYAATPGTVGRFPQSRAALLEIAQWLQETAAAQ